jgi:hypothetical protein
MNPNTLNTFAKWRYQLKLLARWYVSSGSWANSSDVRTLLVSVAIATTRVIALFTYCVSLLVRSNKTKIDFQKHEKADEP